MRLVRSPRRCVGGILVFATALTLVLGACANGTDPLDLGTQSTADGGPASDGNVSSRDTSTNPGDSATQPDTGKDSSMLPTGSHVVINELRTGTEFVELYNPTASAVSLSGWEIRYASKDGNAGSAGHKFTGSDSIGPNSFLLLQNGTWTAGMAATDGQLGLFDGPGTGAKKIDGVAYGAVNAGTLNYGEGASAPNPTATGSVGRVTDGVDTDKNSVDFKAFASPTPNAPN